MPFSHREIYINGRLLRESTRRVSEWVREGLELDYTYYGGRLYLTENAWRTMGGTSSIPNTQGLPIILKRYFCGLLWSVREGSLEYNYGPGDLIHLFETQVPPRPPEPQPVLRLPNAEMINLPGVPEGWDIQGMGPQDLTFYTDGNISFRAGGEITLQAGAGGSGPRVAPLVLRPVPQAEPPPEKEPEKPPELPSLLRALMDDDD